MPSRRDILQGIAAATTVCAAPGLSYGMANTDSRFVVVILRGAMDGLAMLPPYGDGHYASLRGQLAVPGPQQTDGVLRLDGLFGLHPSFAGVHDFFTKNEALLVHAVASPYRSRSHFDGQDVLENGVSSAGARRDGWLNRAIKPFDGALGQEAAIALAQNTPLILRGKQSVTSWAPSRLPDTDTDTLQRIERLYANDEFLSKRLAQALESQAIAGELGNMGGGRRRGNQAAQIKATMQQAGKFLAADGGPRIAVIESGGWDTHANQGAARGALANKFAALDQGLVALADALGAHWSETVVTVVTEFGRTARVNGTRGTDHGTASAAMLLGGALNGGRVIADWPGLSKSALFEGRDLMPTTDIRSIFKGVLRDHLALPESVIERDAFPGSQKVAALDNLRRS